MLGEWVCGLRFPWRVASCFVARSCIPFRGNASRSVAHVSCIVLPGASLILGAWRMANQCTPIRPHYVVFPQDAAGFSIDDQYFIGGSGILVKPVTEQGATEASVYLAEKQVSSSSSIISRSRRRVAQS